MLVHFAITASSGRHCEQILQLSDDKESEYRPGIQGSHGTDTLYGAVPPQGTVAPNPGGHFGQFTQVKFPSGNSTTSWSTWQTSLAYTWIACNRT